MVELNLKQFKKELTIHAKKGTKTQRNRLRFCYTLLIILSLIPVTFNSIFYQFDLHKIIYFFN